MGDKGEGTGGKGGGNWEWGTPLSTPSFKVGVVFGKVSSKTLLEISSVNVIQRIGLPEWQHCQYNGYQQ